MVSFHIVPVIVYLIVRVISYTFRFKRGTFFLSFLEVLELPNYQIRKAHDFTRERHSLTLSVHSLKFSRFQETDYKLKRCFMS